MKTLLLTLLLTLSLSAWEAGQPGDYSYQDYSYQDYSYDVTPPSNGDYNYDTGDTGAQDQINSFQSMSPDDVDSFVNDSLNLYN